MTKTSFPKEKIKVLLLEGIHPCAAQRFRDEGFSVETSSRAMDQAQLTKALSSGVHVLGIRSKTTVPAAALAGAPRLLTIGAFCIGVNQVACDEACKHGVAVFNSPFSNTRSVAELTIAEVIALHRRLTDQSAGMHRGAWDKSAAGAHEVRGRTLGLVGYGHIGSQVSVLAEALGMRVLFYDIVSKLPLGNARPCRTLDELLKASDAVSLHVPATPQTDKLISRAQFKLMKKGAHLINNARGNVVDIPALAEAIKANHLAGAALDVFPNEPAGNDEPFRSELLGLPNVILTPHVGGSTEEAQESIAQDVCEKLLRYVNAGASGSSVNFPALELPPQHEADGLRSHRILHVHQNVPGVLSKINTLIAHLGVNINAQYLQTNKHVGYAVLDASPKHGKDILAGLRDLPETIRARALW